MHFAPAGSATDAVDVVTVVTDTLLSIPSCPFVLSPQHTTPPLVRSAHECNAPAPTLHF
jgi:hypothetical protein